MVKEIKKPVIGIVSKNFTAPDFYNWSWQRINDQVRYAVNKNGGIVLGVLPQTLRKDFHWPDDRGDVKLTDEEITDLTTILKQCDGIILQGGIYSHNYEEYIARYCYEHDLPLLGICAGYNNIIRGLGGKVEKCENTEKHNRPDLPYAHDCLVVDQTSLFHQIIQQANFPVNSVHDYTGTKIPPQLSVVAVDDEQQPEVIEAKDKKFYIGVKFHPELLVGENQSFNGLFEKLIELSKNNPSPRQR